MLDDPEKIQNHKPFRLAKFFLPNTLEIVGQLGFLNARLCDNDLILYANLPEEFRNASLENIFIQDYSRAISKLNELLNLLASSKGATLKESIQSAVDDYREIYRDDYVGLEVLELDGKLFLSIHNGDDLVLQVQLIDTGICWGIERFIVHYQLCGYKLELRDNLKGKQSIVIQPPYQYFSIFPQIRDRNAIAGIHLPEEDLEPVINIYGFEEFMEDGQEKTMQDVFTISPKKVRVLNVYTNGVRDEEIIAGEVEDGIKIDRNTLTIETLPISQKETFATYIVIAESPLNIEGSDLRALAICMGRLSKKITVIKRNTYSIPISTKVEYFNLEYNKALEIRFKDSGMIDAIVFNDKVYIVGEFSMYLSPEGYYIFLLGDTMERLAVNFNADFSIDIVEAEISSVFDTVNQNIDLTISNHYNLGQTLSLN